MRSATGVSATRTLIRAPLAGEIHFLFEPLALLALAMKNEPRESVREQMGETLARAAMLARGTLVKLEPDAASPVQCEYHRAEALLAGVAATALFAGRFKVAFNHCAPGAYSDSLVPGPTEAMADLLGLCELAREFWPEPRWDPKRLVRRRGPKPGPPEYGA